jgi:hypothetical protein
MESDFETTPPSEVEIEPADALAEISVSEIPSLRF